MTSIAPCESAGSQLRIARALGLQPLRLRGGRPPRKIGPRLQLKFAASDDPKVANSDPLLQQLLAAVGIAAHECVPAGGDQQLPELELPSLAKLRQDPAGRRALWPRLRELRRAMAIAGSRPE